MTTPAPKRREQRRTHLDASVVPVERALLARAADLDEREKAYAGPPDGFSPADMAIEFRNLADELHYW